MVLSAPMVAAPQAPPAPPSDATVKAAAASAPAEEAIPAAPTPVPDASAPQPVTAELALQTTRRPSVDRGPFDPGGVRDSATNVLPITMAIGGAAMVIAFVVAGWRARRDLRRLT